MKSDSAKRDQAAPAHIGAIVWCWALVWRVMGAKSSRRAIEVKPAPVPRLTPEAHWTKASHIAAAKVAGTDRSRRLQAAASEQIDAAGYALGRLMDELAAVMPLPAPAYAATLHRLEPKARSLRPVEEKKVRAA